MTSRFALALFLVGMSPAAAAPRQAAPPDRFDGTWSVEIITETGSCDRAYRYPVRIENGRARFIGTAFVVEGGVTRNGAIRGSISNGAATADVRGRLDRNGFGAGTWVASGALSCRGHWNAERRG
ncbi:clustering-based subsystem [Methylobacterium phyllosphaerae]|uniref:Clustering-based subsystem n=2 Tax=Methylobacterium TaxID=407 RepID=A0AAE8HSN3_9HYPH|nr:MULTISPECIES: hypothetical protein [Methylobacterium]APT31840.1 clustering-based subsystem [Methylobacterium phyllosphaerae]KOX40530.1 large exoprotein involved in heme utilization or adhesion [Streptomyces purpurogeneiscleroticus]MBA9062188.1 hypothetical protein [Methylobacterium fujisawaense]SFH02952.1 hypothetical protein SAMN05192567_112122 [Methylobacterium phyllosphaerae]